MQLRLAVRAVHPHVCVRERRERGASLDLLVNGMHLLFNKIHCEFSFLFSGFPGQPGLDGPEGLSGAIGMSGSEGDYGDAGPKGDRGDRGLPGAPGRPGIPGSIITIAYLHQSASEMPTIQVWTESLE
jgi:Collagen triple helix repeat (20 copies)